ncbi:MAG: hypothetical protein MZV63_33515 [Marinilabiliales bacterium]|nr:hypothetical protein [Marinilabiliales bacterium]
MLGLAHVFRRTHRQDLAKRASEPSYPRAQFIAESKSTARSRTLESVWKRKDGSTIIVQGKRPGHPRRPGKTLYYDGIVEDVTEIKSSEKLAAALYGIALVPAVQFRRSRRIVQAHPSASSARHRAGGKTFLIALLTDDGRSLASHVFPG